MKKKLRRFFTLSRSAGDGFTLVELIVVIAILAILAGVAVPVYSGYVKKANEAADQQLLVAVNRAFAAACIDNNIDVYAVTDANLTYGGSEGAVTVTGVASVTAEQELEVAKINESFLAFFQGNEESSFKVFTSLKFDSANHVFVDANASTSLWSDFFDKIMDKISASVAALNGSTFGDIGAAGLMEKVDVVTGMAAEFAGLNGAFKNVLANNLDSMAAALGYDFDNEEQYAAFEAELGAMVSQMATELKAQGGDYATMDEDALMDLASDRLLANYAVLQAAKGTSKDTDTLLNELKTGVDIQNIKNLLKSEGTVETQEGLSKAAMMYAMYTAYANQLPAGDEKDAALENAKDVNGFLHAMNQMGEEGDGFTAYLQNSDGQAKKDLEGYLGALNIINESAESDSAAVKDLLVNGYTDPDLVAALQGLLG